MCEFVYYYFLFKHNSWRSGSRNNEQIFLDVMFRAAVNYESSRYIRDLSMICFVRKVCSITATFLLQVLYLAFDKIARKIQFLIISKRCLEGGY